MGLFWKEKKKKKSLITKENLVISCQCELSNRFCASLPEQNKLILLLLICFLLNAFVLRKTKIVYNFGSSVCRRINRVGFQEKVIFNRT